jgi:hypothetical protein
MLDVLGLWTVDGGGEKVLSTAECLRDAITEARRLRRVPLRVNAIVRRSDELVIVFSGQIERLVALIKADC